MTEFVGHSIGSRHHSYPETRRGANAPPGSDFARNFAIGTAGETATDIPTGAGIQIPWSAIAVGGSPSPNVPITPKSTGYVRLSGMLVIVNANVAARTLVVSVEIDGVNFPIPFVQQQSMPGNSVAAIPIFSEINFVVGVTRNIQIRVSASATGLGLAPQSCILDLQEVEIPTG